MLQINRISKAMLKLTPSATIDEHHKLKILPTYIPVSVSRQCKTKSTKKTPKNQTTKKPLLPGRFSLNNLDIYPEHVL